MFAFSNRHDEAIVTAPTLHNSYSAPKPHILTLDPMRNFVSVIDIALSDTGGQRGQTNKHGSVPIKLYL